MRRALIIAVVGFGGFSGVTHAQQPKVIIGGVDSRTAPIEKQYFETLIGQMAGMAADSAAKGAIEATDCDADRKKAADIASYWADYVKGLSVK
jgi:hypothetical protein